VPLTRATKSRGVVVGVPDQRLQDEWDELAVATGAPPWVRPGWIVPWWREMGRGEPLVQVLRSRAGALRGLLPLQARGRVVTSPTNWHTPEFDLVADGAQARRDLLRQAVETCDGRLTLGFVPRELAHDLTAVCAETGSHASRRVLELSPYLGLEEDWEAGLDRHQLSELQRRGRRLAERGQVTLELADGSRDLDGLLDEGLRIEASGWKGRQGTAILSDRATTAFYLSVSRWAAETGLLRLCFLRLEGRPLAFDLALEDGGSHFLLKTGFDESERAVGPGMLLRLAVLRDCTRRGLATYEFLGDGQPWKNGWTRTSRERWQVHAFGRAVAGTVARALHAGLLPLARRARDGVRR
jgi:CelD/BcsL family acetyltransferase involved in cellulose biosynthesis